VIEEAHDSAHRVLREHMDKLHQLSMILIERETIDKDQFERLLAGESVESVFPEEEAPAAPEAPAEDEKERTPAPAPKPRPLPGAAMQPPEPGTAG
jgi:cell division protease FtsH